MKVRIVTSLTFNRFPKYVSLLRFNLAIISVILALLLESVQRWKGCASQSMLNSGRTPCPWERMDECGPVAAEWQTGALGVDSPGFLAWDGHEVCETGGKSPDLCVPSFPELMGQFNNS